MHNQNACSTISSSRAPHYVVSLSSDSYIVNTTSEVLVLPQAVCPIDSAAVKGITAQQSVQVNGIAAQACASWLTYMLRRRY